MTPKAPKGTGAPATLAISKLNQIGWFGGYAGPPSRLKLFNTRPLVLGGGAGSGVLVGGGGGTGVLVGRMTGTGVFVGGTGVSVGSGVSVGIGVSVGVGEGGGVLVGFASMAAVGSDGGFSWVGSTTAFVGSEVASATSSIVRLSVIMR